MYERKLALPLSFFAFTILLLISCQKEVTEEPSRCESDRFEKIYFTEFTKTTNVEYGKAINVNGINQSLLMDVYQPKNEKDELPRPLIIWVHGGHFISGSKEEMDAITSVSALRGFVSATINYRLLNILAGIPDSTDLFDIVVKSTMDIRQSVSYFLEDARHNNVYNIDTNQIFIGGVSAGSIAAIHTAYLDPSDVVSPLVTSAFDGNGGYLAVPDIQSKIRAVLNLSGAIVDPAIMASGDPALFSFHGTNDTTVPIDKGLVGGEDLKLFEMYGSRPMHQRAVQLGISSLIYEVQGGGHSNIYLDQQFASARQAFDELLYQGLKDMICP